jgi:hypothetical protein
MNVPELLHELVERVPWGSEANKAEAHQAVEADLETVPAEPDVPEGKQP